MNEMIYNTESVVNNEKYKPKQQSNPYTLVSEDDGILEKKVKPFDFSGPNMNPMEIAYRLIDTAKFHDSFCITANQCGIDVSLFVAGSGDNFVAFFNPEIILNSDDTSVTQETDLSNMGFLLTVKRPKSISIQYQDYTGEDKIAQFDGLTSRVIQQCVDRVNGIDFKMRVSKFVLDRAKIALNKRIKKFVKHNAYIKR